MLFLLEGVRPPVAGFLATPSGSAPAAYLSKALEVVQKNGRLGTRVVSLAASTAALADALPLLVLSSGDALAAPHTKMALERLLANGGTAAVLVTTNSPPAAAAAALLPFVPQGKVVPVPENAPFRAVYRGKTKPALQGIQRENGQLAVLLLPVSAAAEAGNADGRLTPAEAVMTLAALIEEYATRTGLSARGFPAKLGGLNDPFTERVQLLNSLGSHGTGLAPDETW
jgi:hypothetical protein